MADPLRLLVEIQGWAASIEAHHDEVMRNLALERAGHPKAQDFEPTGHGGSDPTSANGILPDWAVRQGKRYLYAIERAQKAMREAEDISYRHRNGVRKERQPDDLQDVWCVIHFALGYTEPRAHLDLCDPCYRFKANHNGEYPTTADVEYYETHYGRWPPKRVDPKQHTPSTAPSTHIARLERLQLGTEALPDPEGRTL